MNLMHRRPFAYVILGFMAVCASLSCLGAPATDATPAEAKPLYALCGAYPPELAALHRSFGVGTDSGWTRSVIKGMEVWRGTYHGKDVVIFSTGISLVNAAARLQLALERFPITHILFAGVAGGIDPALQVGDVVIPERWAYHSEAAYLNEDPAKPGSYLIPDYLKPRYGHFGMIFPDDVGVDLEGTNRQVETATFAADPALLEAARRAVPKLPAMRKGGRDVAVHVGGTGVAGTVFLDNAAYREFVFRTWKANCLDMESTALAHVALLNRTPILIIRGLSDLAGGQHGKNPIDANEYRVSEIAVEVLKRVIDEL